MMVFDAILFIPAPAIQCSRKILYIFQVDNALLGISGKPAVDGLPVGWLVVILIDDNAWDLQEGCPAERDRSVI